MSIRFHRTSLAPGLFHMLVDDGARIDHYFNDDEPWEKVSHAAERGSAAYIEGCWQRLPIRDECEDALAYIVCHADASVTYRLSDDGLTLNMIGSTGWRDECVRGWRHLPATADLPVTVALRDQRVLAFATADDMELAHPGLRGATEQFYGTYVAVPINTDTVSLLAWTDGVDDLGQLLTSLGLA